MKAKYAVTSDRAMSLPKQLTSQYRLQTNNRQTVDNSRILASYISWPVCIRLLSLGEPSGMDPYTYYKNFKIVFKQKLPCFKTRAQSRAQKHFKTMRGLLSGLRRQFQCILCDQIKLKPRLRRTADEIRNTTFWQMQALQVTQIAATAAVFSEGRD
jgi:hypothetical protein